MIPCFVYLGMCRYALHHIILCRLLIHLEQTFTTTAASTLTSVPYPTSHTFRACSSTQASRRDGLC